MVAACLLAWAMIPESKAVAAGLGLGTLASLLNALLLQRRILLIDHVMESGKTRRVGLGFGARTAVVLCVALIAYRYSEYFSMPAALAGCFYVQVMAWFLALIGNLQDSNGKG